LLVERRGPRKEDKEEELLVIAASGGSAIGRVSLGKPLLNSRALAVHPSGKFLAVAGGDVPDIRLFPNADPRQEPKILRSLGTTIETASFRKNGNDLGLMLKEAPESGGGKMVFDFTNRKFVPDGDNWKPFTVTSDVWTIVPSGWEGD